VLAFAPAGTADTETEIGLTVAVRRGGEAAIEAALERLDQDALPDASVDLRGPLPPLSFAMVRIASTEPGAVAASWRLLGLPETADAAQLHQAWRTAAAAAHPDRAGVNSGTDAMVAVTTAYHQLRGLLPSGGEPRSLRAVLHAAGHRLVLPDAAGLAARELEPSP
jgi:hypothetical protein